MKKIKRGAKSQPKRRIGLGALCGREMEARPKGLMREEKMTIRELIREALIAYHNEWYVNRRKPKVPAVIEEVTLVGRPAKRISVSNAGRN